MIVDNLNHEIEQHKGVIMAKQAEIQTMVDRVREAERRSEDAVKEQ